MTERVPARGHAVFNNVVTVCLSDAACRGFSRTRCGVEWGWFPDPWRFVRCWWEPGERRLFLFQELSANRKTPAETGAMAAEALTYADEPGGDPYQHDEPIWADGTPDGKQSMAVWRRELGLRVRPARKSNMRRLLYEWLAGLREIVIDPVRCPLAYEEFRLKEFERDRDGTWVDEIPDGNDHSIDAVRYAVMDDVLRGRRGLSSALFHHAGNKKRLSYFLLTVSGSSLTARRPSMSSLCMRFFPWSLLSRVLP